MFGPLLNETPVGWHDLLGREDVDRLARAGVCPWCGRATTIVARVLVHRFQPTADRMARDGVFL